MKLVLGESGRKALYALAATAGELVISLGGERHEVKALAASGAQRCGRDDPPPTLIIKDPTAFAASVDRLSWKRIPTQIFIDGTAVARDVVTGIGERLSTVAPVIVAVSDSKEVSES